MSEAIWLPRIDLGICTGCGDCLLVCPTGALAIVANKASIAAPDACGYDAQCESVCPVGAISLPYEVVLQDMSSERAS